MRRLGQEQQEVLLHGEVESDQERRFDRSLSPGRIRRTLHPVEQPSLDIVTDELVEPQLAVEVVVYRTRGHPGIRSQLPHGHLVEGPRAEGAHGRERQTALRGRRYRNPLAHGTIMPLRYA